MSARSRFGLGCQSIGWVDFTFDNLKKIVLNEPMNALRKNLTIIAIIIIG